MGHEPSGQTGQHVLLAIIIAVAVTNIAAPIKIIFFIVLSAKASAAEGLNLYV